MSELKAGVLVTPHNEGMCFHRSSAVIAVTEGETEFYLKSEADKVIAELKKVKESVLERAVKEIAKQDKEIRHHKYKRCLEMARICECKRIDAANYRIPREKWEFYDKWHRRWLKLAEQFEEVKLCRTQTNL